MPTHVKAESRASTAWRKLRPGLTVLPLVALIGIFCIFPILSIFWESFFGLSLDFSRYAEALTSEVNFHILLRTLQIGAIVTLASLVIAYPVAYHLTQIKPKTFAFVVTLVLVPLFTAFLIRTYAWIIILGRQGIINNTLIWLGLIDEPLTILNSTTAVVIGMTHVFVPMAIFTIYSGMVRIDPSILRAELMLGAHPVKAFARIYFPMTMPSLLSAAVLIYIIAIGFYITPALLGGPADTMISQLVVVQMTTLLDFEMGYALSIVLLVITLAIILLAGLFLPFEAIWSSDIDPQAPSRSSGALRNVRRVTIKPFLSIAEDLLDWLLTPFRATKLPWRSIYCSAVLAFLVAPLLVVILLSFSSSPFVIFPPPGFSLQWWEKLYAAKDWHSALLSSLRLGLAVAAGSTIIGTMGAFWLVRTTLPVKRLLFLFSLAPLTVPVIVIATALYVFEAKMGILGSFPGLMIGHMLLATPYVVVVMSAALRSFDRTLERAAIIHGASSFQTLRRVTLPILAPALITSALLAFLTSFDELLVSIFLLGRQSPTLPIKFWGDIKYQIDPMLSTASTLIVLMVVCVVAFTQWYRLRRRLPQP